MLKIMLPPFNHTQEHDDPPKWDQHSSAGIRNCICGRSIHKLTQPVLSAPHAQVLRIGDFQETILNLTISDVYETVIDHHNLFSERLLFHLILSSLMPEPGTIGLPPESRKQNDH